MMRESRLWSLFILSGIVIFILLGMHLIVMHLSNFLGMSYEEALSFTQVSLRSKSLYFLVSYLLLLVFALFHGFYGIRTLFLELGIKDKAEKIMTVTIVSVGLAFLLYGSFTAIYSFAH